MVEESDFIPLSGSGEADDPMQLDTEMVRSSEGYSLHLIRVIDALRHLSIDKVEVSPLFFAHASV